MARQSYLSNLSFFHVVIFDSSYSTVVLGYFLAMVLLIMIVYLLYREVSADNRRRRLHFQSDADDEMRYDCKIPLKKALSHC